MFDVSHQAYVEHDFVLGSVKHRMQGHGEFHHTQIRSEMATGL